MPGPTSNSRNVHCITYSLIDGRQSCKGFLHCSTNALITCQLQLFFFTSYFYNLPKDATVRGFLLLCLGLPSCFS